jgi:hypothetical protein
MSRFSPISLVHAMVTCLGMATACRAEDSQAPAASTDPEAAKRAVAFGEQVRPHLERYCVACHSGEKPEGDMALAPLIERASVAADRKTWDKIARRLRAKEMPPEDAEKQPEPAERERLLAWVDEELARNDCGGARDPGRVTMRRLNRNEYNNTIRDLCGVDFHPADSFPSDDVGYGFDNIGDVLSMPPILLEKYLMAADDVVAMALGTNLTNHVIRDIEGGQPLDGGVRLLTSQAEVTTKVRLTGEGHYILRVRAYGDQAGDEPVKMGLYIDGKLVRTFEVRAVEKHPETYEAWSTIPGSWHTFSVQFLNDYYRPDDPGPNDRNLYVGPMEIVGPNSPGYQKIIPREYTPEDKMMVSRETIAGFMTRAYRRPVSESEIDRTMKLVELASADGENFASSIGLAMRAILVSPHFLFRVELDPDAGDADGIRELDDFELATRLSYFLWSSMPDDELFSLAKKGAMRQGDNLDAQVRRMLADPKSQAWCRTLAASGCNCAIWRPSRPTSKCTRTSTSPCAWRCGRRRSYSSQLWCAKTAACSTFSTRISPLSMAAWRGTTASRTSRETTITACPSIASGGAASSGTPAC